MNPRRIDWILAFFNVLVIWSIGSVLLCFGGQTLGANSIIYSCVSLFAGSICLLIYTGLGSKQEAKRGLLSIHTWEYGVCLILSFIFTFLLFSKVTPVEGSLLQMSVIILSLILSRIIFKRKPNKFQIIGAILVALGLIIIFYGFNKQELLVNLILVSLMAIFMAGRSFSAETHKEFQLAMERSSIPLKYQLRVIGYVVFLLSCLFLVCTVLIIMYQNYTGVVLHSSIPTVIDFMNYKAIALGVVAGFTLTLPERFIEFNSLARLKTENYLAVGSLSPFAIMFWQYITQDFTQLDLTGFTNTDLIATLIMTIGGLIMIMNNFKISFILIKKDRKMKNLKHAAMFGLDARIALAIFGAQSVISGAALYSAIQNAKATALLTEIQEVGKAWEAFYLDTGQDLTRLATSGGDMYARETSQLVVDPGLNGWSGPYVQHEVSANPKVLKYAGNNSFHLHIVNVDGDDWSNWNGNACNAQPNCYLWTYIYGLTDNYKQLIKKIDELVDNNDGPDKGDFRYQFWAVNQNNVYLKTAPLQM